MSTNLRKLIRKFSTFLLASIATSLVAIPSAKAQQTADTFNGASFNCPNRITGTVYHVPPEPSSELWETNLGIIYLENDTSCLSFIGVEDIRTAPPFLVVISKRTVRHNQQEFSLIIIGKYDVVQKQLTSMFNVIQQNTQGPNTIVYSQDNPMANKGNIIQHLNSKYGNNVSKLFQQQLSDIVVTDTNR